MREASGPARGGDRRSGGDEPERGEMSSATTTEGFLCRLLRKNEQGGRGGAIRQGGRARSGLWRLETGRTPWPRRSAGARQAPA
jgi:hypothetical protein